MPRQRAVSRRHVLRKQCDFRTVFNIGKRSSTASVIIISRHEAGNHMVAFRAARSVGNAVRRNRAKRIIRELYRINRSRIKNDYQFILMARKKVLHNTFRRNEKEFISALDKAGLLERIPGKEKRG